MKKLVTVGLVVTTLVWAMGLAGMVTVPARAASAGDLIKMDGNPAVYYLGSDNKRYVFPNQKCYETWYGNDFSKVVTISQSELESYSIGGNVTYRPGTRLVKITTDPKTYAVEPGGVLRWITSESIAKSLYGDEWYLKIDDVPDPFWVNYTTGSDITDATYPTGTLVKEEGGSTVYYIDGSEKRPIADEAAFTANNFQWDYVITASDLSAYSDGSSITGYESAIATVAGPEVSAPGTSTGTLTVSLASDTPASTTVVGGATWVKFTKVNFTASGGDVTVDSVQIKRMGLAQDSNFSNVYLIDADTNEMHGNEKTLSSTHTAYVTKDFTVSNGTTKSFYIAATMTAKASMNAGETASLAISEVNVKGDATVSGSLPVTGNEMTMNSTISIGTVTPSDGGLASTASKPVGETDYTFSSVKLTVDSTEDVQVERIRFYQSGTAADSDVANLDLLVDGTVLATVAEPNDKYVDFDLSASPYTITKGQNKTFELRGDIVNGSSRTIDFEIYNKADILVKGKTYGFYINPSYSNTSAPYWTNDYPTTISTGTLTVSKAVLSSTNVAEGATQQELGAFYFNAQGEPIIITQMVMELNTSSNADTATDVTNVTVYDENGDVVAGPVDPTSASAELTFTDTFTVPTGIHKYIVKGDLDSDWNADETTKLAITPSSEITAKGETTNNSVTPSPATEITGDTVTVKVADLNVSTSSSPAAQTVAAGTSGFVFANFVLDATQSGEDIKVTQLKVKHTTSAANIHSYITGITLYDGDTALNTPVSGESSTSVSTATSTITLTDPLIIPKGTAKTLTLKADISGSAGDNTTHQFGLVGTNCVTAYGNSTGNSVTPDVINSDGQTMTITTAGTLRMANSGSNPGIGLVIADSSNDVGVFTFDALYEDIEVQKIGFTISGSTNTYHNIDWLQLYEGSTKLGEIQVTGANATITPADLVVPQNSSKTLTLKAVTHKVGTLESGNSGENFTVTITGVEAKGNSTGSTSVAKDGLDNVGTTAKYIYKTVPTVTKVSLSGMANGNQDLYKFTVTADSKGDVGFAKATFKITTTSVTVTNLKLYEDGVDKVETAINATSAESTAGGVDVFNILFDTGVGKEYMLVGAGETKTYVLKGDVTGWDSSASMQIQMLSDNDAVSSLDTLDEIDKGAQDNFIWSDLFLGYNSTTATSANEWTNGYKVFATSSQSF